MRLYHVHSQFGDSGIEMLYETVRKIVLYVSYCCFIAINIDVSKLAIWSQIIQPANVVVVLMGE